MPVNSQLVPTSLEPPAVDSVVLRHHPSDEQASDFPVHPPASLHPAAPWKTVFSRHGHKCPKPSPLSLQVGSWPGLFRVSLAASAISTPEGCFLLAYRLRIKPGLGSKHTSYHNTCFPTSFESHLEGEVVFSICFFLGHSFSFRIFCISLLSPSLTLEELIIFNVNIPLFR